MNTIPSFANRYPVATFSALTIVLSFAAYLLPLPREAIPVVMVFIPALMAVALTAVSEGKTGVRTLLAKLTHWRIGIRWVLIALGLALAMRLAMSLIALMLGLIPAIQLRPGGLAPAILLAVVLFIFALPEELGWRGYALPKLLERRSPLAAALIIGVLWGFLHLALHLPGMPSAGSPLLPTMLQLIGLSVLITWLYVRTGGNVLLTSLFHAAQSFFVILNDGIPPEQTSWLMAGVYLVLAVVVILLARWGLTHRPSTPAEPVPMVKPLV